MAKILKGKLIPQQKSKTSWLVITIKQLIKTISKELPPPSVILKTYTRVSSTQQ